MSKKILVTGGSGFVGKELCRELHSQNYDVIATFRQKARFESFVDGVKYISVGNIDGATDWNDFLSGVDTVIHLAARVHVMHETGNGSLEDFRKVNVEGSLNLARHAVLANVRRFIYLSSIKVNGERTESHSFGASDLPAPQDTYAQSKYEAEQGIWDIADKTGLKVVVVRSPLVYGPEVKANFHKMMRCLAKRIPLPLGAIHNKRSLVGLENLVDLVATCIEHPSAVNQVFLAGDGEDLSTTELLQRIGTALGKPARLFPVPQGLLEFGLKMLGKGDVSQRLCGSLQVDISKARDMLGWNPPVSVDEGLKRTAEWYKNRNEGF